MNVAFLHALEAAVDRRQPVAAITVLDGPHLGIKLLVGEAGTVIAGEQW